MITSLKGNFGFINKPKITIACNNYLPSNLYEKALFSTNLYTIGNNSPDISGGAISLTKDDSEIAALGEYVERYSSSFQMNNRLIYGTYDDLNLQYNCFYPKNIKFYNPSQYLSENFTLKKLEADTPVNWIKSKCFFTENEVLLPFFMTNVENVVGDGMFHINTTTGTATHGTFEKAFESGLYECIERDAFAQFWYLQEKKQYKKYSAEFILNQFPKDVTIRKLFDNKKIKIVIYDVGYHAYCPTFVVLIYFKMKDKIYHSIGSASRLDAKEALIKACLETYQGVEYAQMVCEESFKTMNESEIRKYNFSGIDSFRKHFALYNLFPELRKNVPLFVDALSEQNYDDVWVENYDRHITSFDGQEFKQKGIDEIYYTVLTTPDVKKLGFHVIKVTTPKLHLLTGNFNYPYLGLFKEDEKLFTQFPHPFP